MKHFIGRVAELKELASLRTLRQASLCVMKGCRRIGKSRLLSEFAKSFDYAHTFSGLAPEKKMTAQDQRDEFARQLTTDLTPLNWTRNHEILLINSNTNGGLYPTAECLRTRL